MERALPKNEHARQRITATVKERIAQHLEKGIHLRASAADSVVSAANAVAGARGSVQQVINVSFAVSDAVQEFALSPTIGITATDIAAEVANAAISAPGGPDAMLAAAQEAASTV